MLSIKADISITRSPVWGARETCQRPELAQGAKRSSELLGFLDRQGVAGNPIGRHYAERVEVNDSKLCRAIASIPCEANIYWCRGYQVAHKSRGATGGRAPDVPLLAGQGKLVATLLIRCRRKYLIDQDRGVARGRRCTATEHRKRTRIPVAVDSPIG